MDGVTISIDASTLGLMMFLVYKIVSIEMRIRRLEEKVNKLLE